MGFEIIFEPRALNAAARFPKEDPGGLAMVLNSIDKLDHDPRPAGSVPYGSPSLRRLHTGDYRVLYGIEEDMIRILDTHLGRTA